MLDLELDKLKEECGVFGIYSREDDVALNTYLGLYALQHRGQESAGIAITDGSWMDVHRGMGLVNEVFRHQLPHMDGQYIAIGHVRYSTTGSSLLANTQPLMVNYSGGKISLAHNGNLTNAHEIRAELEDCGTVFQTTIDSEVFVNLIARSRKQCVEDKIVESLNKIKGAYCLTIMTEDKLIGARDPQGFRPLCLGKLDSGYVLSSESCALDTIGAEFVRDIEPGEMVVIDDNGVKSIMFAENIAKAACVFEYIYFARLDSTMDGVKIYDARIRGGKSLAKSYPVEADLVTGVPESGLPAAKGYSEESGIPFGFAFYKNSYIGRTFIKPTQQERESSVHLKLSVLESVVKGKRIVLVDDSIVRGTTIANLIHMLKEAGAKEVHVRISSPPFLHPCYFGTDVPSNDQLIAAQHSTEEIRKMIGADSLGYMQIDYLEGMAGGLPLCKACFDGNYPMEIPAEIKQD